jgi:hypothetical protein
MPESESGEERAGFAFTEDDFRRRYATEECPADGSRPSPPPAPGRPPGSLHGGENSYMRPHRRRPAAAG